MTWWCRPRRRRRGGAGHRRRRARDHRAVPRSRGQRPGALSAARV